MHLAIFGRLGALLTACGRLGSHLMPPQRSGHEFIARLVELEHFASSEPAFNIDPYSCVAESGPSPVLKFGKIEEEHSFKTKTKFSPLRPYRMLDAERLKLTGTGKWPLHELLDDILWLTFLEPSVLLHGGGVDWPGPDFSKESRAENLKLARLWDSKGLLALFHEPLAKNLYCRAFNARKNESVDRQIGDRRWVNGADRHPQGPSALLPATKHCFEPLPNISQAGWVCF